MCQVCGFNAKLPPAPCSVAMWMSKTDNYSQNRHFTAPDLFPSAQFVWTLLSLGPLLGICWSDLLGKCFTKRLPQLNVSHIVNSSTGN